MMIGACGTGAGTDPADAAPPDAAAPDAAPPDAAAPDAAPPDAAPPIDPTLALFDLGRIHRVDLTVAPEHLEQLDVDFEHRVPCTFTFDGLTLPDVGIRQKGGYGSSSNLAGKPGFSVAFDAFVDGQTLHGERKVLLNNAVQDPTFLHEHLGYELYRRSGIPAARTAHAIVSLNGFVYGIYVIKEAIDKRFLERWFGDGSGDGNLYEQPCCGDFVWDPYFIELKDEIEDERSRADLLSLVNVIRDAPDDDFVAQVTGHLDLAGFITGYALDALLVHWDGYSFNTNNFYLYHDPVSDRLRFIPHGMDQLLQDLGFLVDAWPNGRLAQRVREIPVLDDGWRAAVEGVLGGPWDVAVLQARCEDVAALVDTIDATEDRTAGDVQSFRDHLPWTLEALAQRPGIVREMLARVCGDTVVQAGEQCDDGNLDDGDGCNAACFWEYCGDGVVQIALGEVCDGWGCRSDCTGPATCETAPGPHGDQLLVCPFQITHWEARAECAMQGGTLAVIADATENALAASVAQTLGEQPYWVGIDDEDHEGVWMDGSGVPATYLPWGPGEPNGDVSENCGQLFPWHGWTGWNDAYCGNACGYVCRLP
jgi:cysteine-rich repeat protein